MQRFGNGSHDDIQKLMDKSKNNTTNDSDLDECVSWLGETFPNL